MNTKIERVTSKHDYARCVAIRTMVFVSEQGYPLHEEYRDDEGLWEDYLLWNEGRPEATARWRMLNEDVAKIGMIATQKEYRRQGHAKALVSYLSDMILARDEVTRIEMSAQDSALPLYEGLGYKVIGDGYMDGHIPHHKIVKEAA